MTVEPYYSDDHVTIYHGDCLEIMGGLAADVLVTDPPYGRQWEQGDTTSHFGWRSNANAGISGDASTAARDAALGIWGDGPAIVFGDLMLSPPGGTKIVLVFDKGATAGFTGAVGGYRRNVEGVYLLGRHSAGLGGRSSVIRSAVNCGGNLARTTGHPHTKPVDVMRQLLEHAPPGTVLDPFMGSGSTLRAAKDLGRRAIGIEIEERYCEVAAQRCAQEVLVFG